VAIGEQYFQPTCSVILVISKSYDVTVVVSIVYESTISLPWHIWKGIVELKSKTASNQRSDILS